MIGIKVAFCVSLFLGKTNLSKIFEHAVFIVVEKYLKILIKHITSIHNDNFSAMATVTSADSQPLVVYNDLNFPRICK